MKIYHFKNKKGDFVDGNEMEEEFMQRVKDQGEDAEKFSWIWEELWANAVIE